MRKPYHDYHTIFLEDDLVSSEPIKQFGSWFQEAVKHDGIMEANAMCLATATKYDLYSNSVS